MRLSRAPRNNTRGVLMLSDSLTFSGGYTVHPGNLKLSVVLALFRTDEIVKLHEAFITSQVPHYLKREVIRSAKILAGANQETSVAFVMWLLAVHEHRDREESPEKTAALILTGDIDVGSFLVRED